MLRLPAKITASTLRQLRVSSRHMYATPAIKSPAAAATAAPRVKPVELGKTGGGGSAFEVPKERDVKIDEKVPGTEGKTGPGGSAVAPKEEFAVKERGGRGNAKPGM